MRTFARDLTGMARPEVEAAFAAGAPFLIPTGSVEQHGPHLPLGTDYLAAWSLANLAAERLEGVCVPFCPFGVTPIHMAYPGTITLEPATFQALLEEVVTSLIGHGARRIAVVNWHELNSPSIEVATRRLATRHAAAGVRLVVAEAHLLARERFGRAAGGLTHGGELEVYPVLDLEPGWAHLERATDPPPAERAAEMDAMRRTAHVRPVLHDVRQISPAGWYGEPARATPEKAARFMRDMAGALAQRIAAAFAEIEP
ncbi:MAG TPA: creatininase family protein [Candidatus Dormibacteraeota bacterium]|nr:creatininase family protein [Candidatus Dormibacteraeota bacterium]